MTEEGNLIQGRYRVERPLGSGGMAEVWQAVDERLERPVAIKFLTGRYVDDPEFLVRFFSEGQAVAGISDGNVVPVLDFGTTDEGPFLVMELVEGGTLQGLTGDQLPVEQAVSLVAQAASGVGAAHRAGIVHRDIKPSNILIDRSGTVKLADFGIATLEASEDFTATGTAIGSPLYISPEGAQGNGCDPPSDVYSLGIVLYELLAGRPPFEAASPTALAIAHVERAPDPPSVARPDLPEWLEAIVMTCLRKDPALRYQDGNELAAALRAGEAAAASSAAAGGNERFGSKPRLVAAAVGAVAALALGGFLFASPGSDSLAPPAEAETDAARGKRAGVSPSPAADSAEGNAETVGYETEGGRSATPSPSPSADDNEKDAGEAEEASPSGTPGRPGRDDSSSGDPSEEDEAAVDEPEPVETTDEGPDEEEPGGGEEPEQEEPTEENPEPEPSPEGDPQPAPSTQP